MIVTYVCTSPSRNTKHINMGSVSWVCGVCNLHPFTFLSIHASCWHPHIGNTRFNMKELELLTSQETPSLLFSPCISFCPSDWMIYVDRDKGFSGIEKLERSTSVSIVGTSPSRNTKHINVRSVSWVCGVSDLHPFTFLSISTVCWHPQIGDAITCFCSVIFEFL